MNHQPSPVEAFYQRFLASLAPDSDFRQYRWIAEAWGAGAMADELGHLIASGKKTASCTTWWEYAADGCQVPALDLLVHELFHVGYSYYRAGSYMAQQIDKKAGRQALIDVYSKGPISIIKLYNSLAEDGLAVQLPGGKGVE